MISRRNYFSITVLMVFVLFLCMSINYLKDGLNDYAVNRYTETAENYPSKTSMYVPNHSKAGDSQDPAAGSDGEETVVPRDLVVCIGDQNKLSMQAAAEWTSYTKRNIEEYSSLASYRFAGVTGEPPEMLVIDPDCVNWSTESAFNVLEQCLENGTSLVFCGLPDVSVIQNSQRVRELLGIQSVRAEETTVMGFYLRGGFLLGGATFYLERSGADTGPLPGSGAFPGERTFPWYLPAAGTKTYMKGVPENGEIKPEEWPIVMWRKSAGDAYVFAVNGPFMEGPEAIGLLSAMSAEMHPYEIYPVVNAQGMVLANYPSLADENAEEMDRIYSRPSIMDVFQKLTWPGISSALQQQGYKATCMITPQYDYSDDNLPDEEVLEYYLKTFGEQAVETGLSGPVRPDTDLMKKLGEDYRFFQDAIGGYSFVSFWAGALEDDQIMGALEADTLASARTVVRAYDETRTGPVGFLSENVTAQSALGDGLEYTYKSDFRVRGMETALGYLNMSFDMSRVAYPESAEDQWENLSKTFGSTVSIYGQQYGGFDRTTAAECDMRIRQFLAMDYSESRTGDRVKLHVQGVTGPVWFILRTHSEAILEMEGGSWEKLEEGAYLVEVTQEDVVLTLGAADERHYR